MKDSLIGINEGTEKLTLTLLTFTCMHLSDAFIKSDLHCSQVTVFNFFLSALAFPGNQTHDLGVANAMLYYLSYRKAKLLIGIKADLL